MIRATLNSWNGITAAARSEAAFRLELVALGLAVPLALVIASGPWEWAALVAVVLLVLVVELLNTGVEKLSDHVTSAQHPEIGRIKDMTSAAVGLSLAAAGIVWLTGIGEWLGLW